MSTLRVLVDPAPQPSSDVPWALYDAQQRLVRSGSGPASTWPSADHREAVLRASAVRLVVVALPPMPADRVAAAAAYALEDQLAGPAHAQHLVASARRRDGRVEIAIAARSLFAPLQKAFERVVAEPAAAPVPPSTAWRWYGSGPAGGFVRRPDGSAFAVSAPAPSGPVPPELALPLAQAARTAGSVTRIEVAFPAEDAQLRDWAAQCGVAYQRVAAWRWDQDGAALAAASDLLQGEFSRAPRAAPVSAARRFRWAAGVGIAALSLHVGATFAEWAWLRYQDWQVARAIVATARSAGAGEASDADTAAAALSKHFADARHRAALAAPADALPLLARAAPALAMLPAGTLKSATYAGGAWTFDLGKVDPALAGSADRQLALAGLATLTATTAAGTRMRIGPAAGTERP